MFTKIAFVTAFLTASLACAVAGEKPLYQAVLLKSTETFDARQGIAVDENYFYATNNFRITKHDRKTGRPLLQWDGEQEGAPLVHLDSMMELDGRLYAAHSNYGQRPMTSSVEIWDAGTMAHIGTHSFGINRGSFTWLDRHKGFWWGAFANYDRVPKGQTAPYGETLNTQIVKMDNNFNILQSWTLPEKILQRMRPMSNSGGSWGPDGYLYLTGHDHGELYVMELPRAGSVLHWAATVKVPNMEGQGIAWDRSSSERRLWAIRKKDRMVFEFSIPEITETIPHPEGRLHGKAFNKN
ncbi:hypothetical protein [Emcibacter sp.]|uniref:hypothetical protein n=1 Tax=Emcibacter sp. TaxID=1979954 RepID=UPI003A90DC87